ncbi:amidase family protein [Hymenobacter crusticola]|uniref:amidase family protein n=1 Tax=Hymenobacter crusticola TaxID=1770526 RepID=UPI001C4EBA58|nr:amidase family protein [Hymenobacter crusticola]
MELKPAFREATAGHEADMFTISKAMLATPDTAMQAYILAEQAAERLRDGFAAYFQRYDALLCPVLPIPAHEHGKTEFIINGQTVPATHLANQRIQRLCFS